MNEYEREFLKAYHKACYTSQPGDWMEAALCAKHMYNEARSAEAKQEEVSIAADAALKYS